VYASVSKRGLEMEHLSLYRGSIRGTWRVGFFSGDSEKHVRKGFEREHLSLIQAL
jgi:hypothetical protein